MVKKSNIFGIAVMLGLAITNLSGAIAGENNLVQLDLRKTSNNAIDLTFFTTTPYQNNIVVRKKSDNKYVVLMPKVMTSGYAAPDLNGVKDLVSHIDVKSVNESGNTYTKVTLITTKPLDIKTKTQKTAPITAEQQEYKTLIAEANAIKNNIGKNASAPKVSVPQKTNITVNKIPVDKAETTKPDKTDKVKPKSDKQKLQEIKPQSEKTPVTKITEKLQTQTKEIKETISAKTAETQASADLSKIVPESVPTSGQSVTEPAHLSNNLKDIQELLPKKEKISLPSISLVLSSIQTKAQTIYKEVESKMPVSLATVLTFILIPILGVIIISKIIKASLLTSKALKESFLNHLAEQPPILNTLRYNNIVNDKELNWQQKYQKYLDASAKPVSRGANKGHYTFIKQPAPTIEEKRIQLEKLVTADTVPVEEQPAIPEIKEVQNEENIIHEELQRTIKLKGFDTSDMTNSLSMSHRDKIKSRFKKYDEEKPRKTKKTVELGSSVLHTNRRRMKNSNLNVSEIQALKQRAKEMNIDANDYVMSSVEEFFSILDKEQESKTQQEIKKTTNPISSSIEKIKPTLEKQHDEAGIMEPVKKSITSPMSISKQTTNPIEKLRNETKKSYINGLIVKSGFNIDNNKGFYIVNLDGKSALIGRVNDEVFVLKKFDKNVDKPIQVRHDNANVYMVKADGFKSLVEVNENKMGVLIEL